MEAAYNDRFRTAGDSSGTTRGVFYSISAGPLAVRSSYTLLSCTLRNSDSAFQWFCLHRNLRRAENGHFSMVPGKGPIFSLC